VLLAFQVLICMNDRLKFINFNMLIVAVCLGHKPEVLDYLLEKGQDPTAVGSKGQVQLSIIT